jgi:hypothetical protein
MLSLSRVPVLPGSCVSVSGIVLDSDWPGKSIPGYLLFPKLSLLNPESYYHLQATRVTRCQKAYPSATPIIWNWLIHSPHP